MHLVKVGGAGVVVHIEPDLVDAGQRVEHRHISRSLLQHLCIQGVAAFQPEVILLVEKAFLLDAGHVENIEGGQFGFEVGGLLVGLVERRQRLVLDVLRDAQFLRRDEDEPVSLKLAQRGGQGVDRPDDTYITNLIHASVDPKTVQYLAGHESSKITMDIYAKVKYNRPEQLAGVLEDAFASWD